MHDKPLGPPFLRRKRDDRSDTLKVNIGIEVATGKVGLEFSEPVKEFRMDPDRARKIALALLKICDAIEKPPAGRVS